MFRDEHMLPFRDDEEELDTTWQWRVIEGASQLKGRLLIDRQGYKFTEKTYAGRDYVSTHFVVLLVGLFIM